MGGSSTLLTEVIKGFPGRVGGGPSTSPTSRFPVKADYRGQTPDRLVCTDSKMKSRFPFEEGFID